MLRNPYALLLVSSTNHREEVLTKERGNLQKRYGYDSTLYSSEPTKSLEEWLVGLLPSLDIDIMPGETDPTGPTLPQQGLHPALLGRAMGFSNSSKKEAKGKGKEEEEEGAREGGLVMCTNPCWSQIGNITYILFLSLSCSTPRLMRNKCMQQNIWSFWTTSGRYFQISKVG